MKKWKSAVLTLMFAVVCATLILPAGAATRFVRQLEAVYRDIKILVDGTEITPTDVNGNTVEPFIVDGLHTFRSAPSRAHSARTLSGTTRHPLW